LIAEFDFAAIFVVHDLLSVMSGRDCPERG
jgi:hypothetical protein